MADIEAAGAIPPLLSWVRRFVRAVVTLGLLWVLTTQGTVYGLLAVHVDGQHRQHYPHCCAPDLREDTPAVAIAWYLLRVSLFAAVMLFLIAMALALFAILVCLLLSIPGAARATRVRL